MAAYYNDAPARLPVNLPNTGGALPGFDEDVVVEVWCDVDGRRRSSRCRSRRCREPPGRSPRPWPSSSSWPPRRPGAAPGPTRSGPWSPTRSSQPAVAEELYDELAYANRDYLPERLLR